MRLQPTTRPTGRDLEHYIHWKTLNVRSRKLHFRWLKVHPTRNQTFLQSTRICSGTFRALSELCKLRRRTLGMHDYHLLSAAEPEATIEPRAVLWKLLGFALLKENHGNQSEGLQQLHWVLNVIPRNGPKDGSRDPRIPYFTDYFNIFLKFQGLFDRKQTLKCSASTEKWELFNVRTHRSNQIIVRIMQGGWNIPNGLVWIRIQYKTPRLANH